MYQIHIQQFLIDSFLYKHQVVRLVHELSVVLLHAHAMHIRGDGGRRPLERILLLEVVASRVLLLRAALAVRRRRFHLHLEVGLLSIVGGQVMVRHLM